MAKKKGGGANQKVDVKKREKVVQDKTFGLKNKNKSKKVQQYVAGVKSQVMDTPAAIAARKKKVSNLSNIFIVLLVYSDSSGSIFCCISFSLFCTLIFQPFFLSFIFYANLWTGANQEREASSSCEGSRIVHDV